MKKVGNILIALIPAILAFFMILYEPFFGLDEMLCDLMYSQMNGAGDDIKIITIDEETLSEYGPLSEWSREKSAELIDILYEDKDVSPAVLA